MLQVAVTDLSPAGPIQAVEIQVESSSLANMCRVHHAIVKRIQVPQPARVGMGVLEGGSEGSKRLSGFPLWTHATVSNMVHCHVNPPSKQDPPLQMSCQPLCHPHLSLFV